MASACMRHRDSQHTIPRPKPPRAHRWSIGCRLRSNATTRLASPDGAGLSLGRRFTARQGCGSLLVGKVVDGGLITYARSDGTVAPLTQRALWSHTEASPARHRFTGSCRRSGSRSASRFCRHAKADGRRALRSPQVDHGSLAVRRGNRIDDQFLCSGAAEAAHLPEEMCSAINLAIAITDPPLTRLLCHRNVLRGTHRAKKGTPLWLHRRSDRVP
jgi:hypothetical protein